MWWKSPYICSVLSNRIHYKYCYKIATSTSPRNHHKVCQILYWKPPQLHHICTTSVPHLHHICTTTSHQFHHSLITTTYGVLCGVFTLVKFTTYAFHSEEPTISPPASLLADHQNVQNGQEATSGHVLQCLVKESSISFIASAEPITPHKTLPHTTQDLTPHSYFKATEKTPYIYTWTMYSLL